jgi:hypothetical protein
MKRILIASALVASNLHAATLTTHTLDGGGRKTASANYSSDGSLGGIGGISTVASPQETVKHSYIGQLYDVTGVTVTASPTNVNEGGTRQLGAASALDDATALPLQAGDVSWSVANGPLASISAGGLATASNVYQDTAATAKGSYQSKTGTLGLAVLNVNLDNYGTYASDGIDDAWQVQFFGENNANAGPGVDADGDQQNNLFEYVAGLVPTNAASLFLLSVSNVAGVATQKNIVFSPRFSDRTYFVRSSTNLAQGGFAPVAAASTNDNGPVRTITDLGATEPVKSYGVHITRP